MAPPLRNALSVDVEDYFQVSAFETVIDRSSWDHLPLRVADNTARLLDLFAEHQAKATFFVLGWVAEKVPALVRRLLDEGHELASHGYDHTRVHNQDPASFRADVLRTKALLEDLGGQPVLGYRAASYSIDARNLWALDILAETGHRYSSSIYPVRHDLYGMPDAPRFAHTTDRGLLEIPISTIRLAGHNLPCGGGGYFRLLPYRVSRWAIGRVNRLEAQPCVFYFHPWEIDPAQPRQGSLKPRTRFRHYLNLSRMEPRLHRLLSDFSWGRMDEIFLPSSAA